MSEWLRSLSRTYGSKDRGVGERQAQMSWTRCGGQRSDVSHSAVEVMCGAGYGSEGTLEEVVHHTGLLAGLAPLKSGPLEPGRSGYSLGLRARLLGCMAGLFCLRVELVFSEWSRAGGSLQGSGHLCSQCQQGTG